MLHPDCQPLFATDGDELLVDGDLGADDLGLCIIETERGIEEWMVLEGLPVDVKDELSLILTSLLIKINSGFDAADIVREGGWECRSGGAEGNA